MMPQSNRGSSNGLLLVQMAGQEVLFYGRTRLHSWITDDQGNLQAMTLGWTPCFGITLKDSQTSTYGAYYSQPLPYEP
jgi:hypothetical protein